MKDILDVVFPIEEDEVDNPTLADAFDGLPYLPEYFNAANTED